MSEQQPSQVDPADPVTATGVSIGFAATATPAPADSGGPADPGAGAGPDLAELAVAVAGAVQAVPGVARLEPTLRSQLRGLSGGPLTVLAGGGPPDGVVLSRRGGLIEARIDIAVRPVRPADRIAADVRGRVAETIVAAAGAPGRIAVSVLAVD